MHKQRSDKGTVFEVEKTPNTEGSTKTPKEEQLWSLVCELDDLLTSHLLGVAKPEEVRYRYAAVKEEMKKFRPKSKHF